MQFKCILRDGELWLRITPNGRAEADTLGDAMDRMAADGAECNALDDGLFGVVEVRLVLLPEPPHALPVWPGRKRIIDLS